MAYFWCLVSNPRRWPIFDFLGNEQNEDAWRISPNLVQIPNQVAEGQYAILRVGTGGGQHHPPGIYAICRLLSGAMPNTAPEVAPLLQGPQAFDGPHQVVRVEFLARFLGAPLTITRLEEEANLGGRNIQAGLIQGRQTSIFEISEADFEFVANLLQWQRPLV